MPIKQFDIMVSNKSQLDNCYLPFVKNGGLFIATNDSCQLREVVQINLQLYEQTEPITWQEKVVFVNPPYASGKFPTGIGVSVPEKIGEIVWAKIKREKNAY
jgi:type IV pilus assembly protein PilZ